MKSVVHLKTGNVYSKVNQNVINATNADDGQIMVLYVKGNSVLIKLVQLLLNNIPLFVREKQEFLLKFKEK
jgi:hypothetical protein